MTSPPDVFTGTQRSIGSSSSWHQIKRLQSVVQYIGVLFIAKSTIPGPYQSNPLAYGAVKDPFQDRNPSVDIASMALLLPIYNLLCATVADNITVSENKLCSIFVVNVIKELPEVQQAWLFNSVTVMSCWTELFQYNNYCNIDVISGHLATAWLFCLYVFFFIFFSILCI